MPFDTESIVSLGNLAKELDGAGIPWALFAGAAASVYGAERAVTDLDVLVPHDQAERLEGLWRQLHGEEKEGTGGQD